MTGDQFSIWLGNPASSLGMFLVLLRIIGRVQSFLASPGMLIRLWSDPCYGQKVCTELSQHASFGVTISNPFKPTFTVLCVLLLFSFLFRLSLFGLPLLLLICRLRRKHKTSFKVKKAVFNLCSRVACNKADIVYHPGQCNCPLCNKDCACLIDAKHNSTFGGDCTLGNFCMGCTKVLCRHYGGCKYSE